MTLQGIRNRMTSDIVKMLLSAFIVLCSLTMATKSFAEDSPNRGDVLYDFFKMAFADKMWNEDKPVGQFKKALQKFPFIDSDIPQSTKQSRSWLLDNIDRASGVPDNGVIHKWTEEITIGFGHPFSNFVPNQNEEVLKRTVDKMIPELEQATGLPVRLITPDQDSYKGNHFGRIRIMPVMEVGDQTFSSSFAAPEIPNEARLWEAELFENANSKAMRGFLLPKSNNELDVVVCKIKVQIAPADFQSQVEECLLRSVGLPGAMGGDPVHYGDVDQSEQTENSPFARDRALKVISLLYCPDIKSGMSKNKALYALYNSNQCKF